METTGEDEDNENENTNEPNNTSSSGEGSNSESISGIVETVGNMQFEITCMIDVEIEGVEGEVGVGFDVDAPLTTVVIDEQTVFEIV